VGLLLDGSPFFLRASRLSGEFAGRSGRGRGAVSGERHDLGANAFRWTLVTVLHINRRTPARTGGTRDFRRKIMAKKPLKKAKKLEPTKPLTRPGISAHKI
jgi:hypothetical protein